MTIGWAQQPATQFFEAATVRASAPTAQMRMLSARTGGPATDSPGRMRSARTGGPATDSPGRITFTNAPLKLLIQEAFDIQEFSIRGPSWLDSQRFDVAAKIPPNASKEQVREMLRNLLIARFALNAHFESQLVPGYVLRVAPRGSKLHTPGTIPSGTGDHSSDGFAVIRDGYPALSSGQKQGFASMVNANRHMMINARIQPVSSLVDHLRKVLRRPVRDETRLEAEYDFQLEYVPEGLHRADGLPDAEVPADGPNIESALKDQLGLTLAMAKIPAKILVIESAQRVPVAID